MQEDGSSNIGFPPVLLDRIHILSVYYSNAARGNRRRDQAADIQHDTAHTQPAPPPATAVLRKRWANLLRTLPTRWPALLEGQQNRWHSFRQL
jgi:hypothetical protein